MYRADSVFTATTGVAQRKRWNRFRRTILTPIRPPQEFPLLIPTKGGEIGVRTVAAPTSAKHLFALVSPQRFRTAAELATPEARLLQDSRAIAMASNGRTTTRHWSIWLLILTLRTPEPCSPQSTKTMRRPNSPGGKRVPEAVGLVISSGVTLHDYKGFSTSLRLRYFGPRDLTSDGIYRSQATALLNAEVGYQISKRWRFAVEFLNLLNRKRSRHRLRLQIPNNANSGLGIHRRFPSGRTVSGAIRSAKNF